MLQLPPVRSSVSPHLRLQADLMPAGRSYAFLYVLVIKSVGVYCADIYTMVLLLASNHWAGQIIQANEKGSTAVQVPFSIGKWIFFGCIIFSFLLLAWEARKSRAIIRSRDISYAYTNVMAVRAPRPHLRSSALTLPARIRTTTTR